MSTPWTTVRVFISSTFRDMQAERDHLVRFVFPQLREALLPRRIHQARTKACACGTFWVVIVSAFTIVGLLSIAP